MTKSNFSKISMKWRIVLAFAAIYLIWGSTYLAIRLAIETIPPYLMGGVRFLDWPGPCCMPCCAGAA